MYESEKTSIYTLSSANVMCYDFSPSTSIEFQENVCKTRKKSNNPRRKQNRSLKKRKWLNPFKIYANRVARSSLNRKCQICESKENHVRHVRKIWRLPERNVFAESQTCVENVHQGFYDGIKLTNLSV